MTPQPDPAPKRCVGTIRIRGLAERANSPEHRLGPDVTVPDSLPVLVEFSREQPPVGTATLTRDSEGIHADATLYLTGWFRQMATKQDIQVLWPKFALAIARTVITKDDGTDVITAGDVVALSLCRENVDRDLPPWEVVCDDCPA